MKKTFYGLDKKAGYKVWNITVKAGPAGDAYLVIEHGKDDGKLTEKVDYFGAGYGKQGRTPYEQAISEAEGRIKKQIDKGYRENKDDLGSLDTLAMLAADYRKQGHRIEYPCYGSVKYDGVRALAKKRNGVVTLESRTSQPYDIPHLTKILDIHMQDGDIWDGEVYVHNYELQDIVSAVKRTDTQKEIDSAKKKHAKSYSAAGLQQNGPKYEGECEQAYIDAVRIHELRQKLQFHIFDVVSDKPFSERVEDLDKLCGIPVVSPCIQITEYGHIDSEEAMKEHHKWAVSQGYEGSMLRNFNGLYESGKRSANLQKFKMFLDSEFNILDVVPDKQGNGVFVCKNDISDNEFQVVMGSMTERLSYLENKDSLKGKYLTVKYQSRYKDTLLPQFPVGLQIRDGKVINGEFVPNE